MLRGVDLCSGIGGNAYAFKAVATTTLYCERDPQVRQMLRSAMKAGHIDAAPIHRNMRTLKLAPGSVDFITAGWPCQGNSRLGKKAGMKDSRSGLIRQVVRLIAEAKPSLVLLENVPEVLRNGSLKYLLEQLVDGQGYVMSWGSVSAQDVGYPHLRERFFALAVRRTDAAYAHMVSAVAASRGAKLQAPGTEPYRTVPRQTPHNKLRTEAMGNSVVPAACKLAFEQLADVMLQPTRPSTWHRVKGGQYPRWGVSSGVTQRWAVMPAPPRRRVDAGLVFDPAAYSPGEDYKPSPFLKPELLIKKPAKARLWATPRHGCTNACRILTRRSMNDIATQVRFEAGTPDAAREGVPSAEFLEHIMGYPVGYTDH